MVLHLNELLSDDTTNKAVSFCNSNNGKILIYLNSRGGSYEAMEAILDIVNRRKSKTTIIAYGCIASAAFELFFSSKCHKEIIGGCIGMYHQSKIDVTVNEKRKVCLEDRVRISHMDTYMANRTKELCLALKMSKDEIAKIEEGEDLWFGVNRMNEFVKNIKSKP